MISLVQQYGSIQLDIEGGTFLAPCLVEDEAGDRWLVVPPTEGTEPLSVAPTLWADAAGSGAVGIVMVHEPRTFSAITTEHFMEKRYEDRQRAAYTYKGSWAGHSGRFPSFDSMAGWGPNTFDPASDPWTNPDSVGQIQGTGMVQLHTHTEFSQYDGLSTIDEAIAAAQADGQTAIAITDHGTCASHPLLQAKAKEAGIKPIYGMEGYLVDDRFARGAEVRYKYHHLVLWALTDEGLRNLWAISTEAHREGFYQVPRFDWDTLERLGAGIAASTACLSGPLSYHLNPNKPDADPTRALMNLGRLKEIFGDRLYIEMHANNLSEQREVNVRLAEMARAHSVPMVAVADSHYATKDDKPLHGIWYAMKNAKGAEDATESFAGGADLHISTADEVRLALAYLPRDVVEESIANTRVVAARCTADVNTNVTSTPTFSKGDGAVDKDIERLKRLCESNWQRKTKGRGKRFTDESYRARYDRELKLLIAKGFCGYFLMVADYVKYAKDHGVLVGPGRGSGGGSLVAYLADITEVDPVEAELLFERFLTEGRKALPDFDIDFPSSKSDFIAEYIRSKYGADHVVQVGTVGRLKNKGALRETARFFAARLEYGQSTDLWRDMDAISKIIDGAEAGSAGLGMDWEELWAQHEEELGQYRQKWPEWIATADRLVGRLKNYGKHAAGIVISTEGPLTDWLPMRMSDDGVTMVSQFDMEAIEALGLVKFDFLKLRTLDTLQQCIDMIEERYKLRINVYEWVDEYFDPLVWSTISDGDTLGVFQIETTTGTQLTTEFKPQNLSEMSDILTLVRPGPKRSGLTDTYMNRRGGYEEVSLPDRRLEAALSKSYGCLLYQEDIMATCMIVAGYDGEQADKVRKILGKKQVEKVIEEGKKFVNGAVENGMARGTAEHLWNQMAEFAKYSFNRAHAYAYGIISYWCAWLKVNYPVEYLVASLSTVKPDRIPEFVESARHLGYKVLPPDVNESGVDFRYAGDLVIRYGFLAISGVGDAAAPAIVAGQPYASVDDFEAKKPVDVGIMKKLVRCGAFEQIYPNRRALEALLEFESSGSAARCQHRDDEHVGAPNNLPCTFDWASEPQPPQTFGRSGKPLKLKILEPPKKCTVRCRNYTKPDPLDISSIPPYTDGDIRDLEMELLGIYLSSTPFDRVSPEHMEVSLTARQLKAVEIPEGSYLVVAIVNDYRTATTKAGNPMAFVKLNAVDGELDAPIFSESMEKYGTALKKGNLVMAEVKKRNGNRFNIAAAMPL